ncbi:hypothetical protein PsYK624_100540 [Phanerochaete sordida]|uniref:Uncharacterized protein n=1 Tax=Phanerochaete sordida TaxID=48140 RepID=A0A9P3GD38_9APHY|nr:hypothetical protein PsYK624_100540 [Phanerochaete sordida]
MTRSLRRVHQLLTAPPPPDRSQEHHPGRRVRTCGRHTMCLRDLCAQGPAPRSPRGLLVFQHYAVSGACAPPLCTAPCAGRSDGLGLPRLRHGGALARKRRRGPRDTHREHGGPPPPLAAHPPRRARQTDR